MIQLWRLYREQYGAGLDGIGGTFADGRWHSRGQRAVYFGASASITVLERLAHLDPDLLPDDLQLGLFELSDSKKHPSVTQLKKLPANWAQDLNWSRRTGNEWLESQSHCLLAVPSVILPEETNYLLNPLHPAAKSIHLVKKRPFHFDSRLI